MGLLAEVMLGIVVSLFALPLSWTVHELSHWAAARLVGIPLLRVRLGPLAIDAQPAGWRLRYLGLKGHWAGVAPDLDRASPEGLRARAAFLVAAGALGELLVAIGIGVVALRGGGLPFWVGAVVVAVSGLSNLLPMSWVDEGGELRSDGGTLWELLLAPDRAHAWLASRGLVLAVFSGQRRPRDLDERWVALAISAEPSSAALALGRMMAHHSALDRGDGERATELLLSAPAMGELLPVTRRPQLAAWTAYSVALFHKDVEGAGQALDVIDDWSGNEWMLDLSTAAVSLASGRPDDALTLCDWLLMTRWREGDGYAAMLRDQVEALRSDAEAAVRAGPSPEHRVSEDRPARTDGVIPTEKAEAVAGSLNQRAEELEQNGRREDASAIYGEVVRRFGDHPDSRLRYQVALALLNGGVSLERLDRKEEALAAWEEMTSRSGDPSDPWMRHCVFIAGYNRATTLQELGRHQEALEAYDEILRRFGDLKEPDDQARLALAMTGKGTMLAELDRQSEALRVYDEVLRRYGDDKRPGTLSTVARTLILKAAALRRLGRHWEADAATDSVLRRFGGSQDPALAEWVDDARREKQRALSGTGAGRRRSKRHRSR